MEIESKTTAYVIDILKYFILPIISSKNFTRNTPYALAMCNLLIDYKENEKQQDLYSICQGQRKGFMSRLICPQSSPPLIRPTATALAVFAVTIDIYARSNIFLLTFIYM